MTAPARLQCPGVFWEGRTPGHRVGYSRGVVTPGSQTVRRGVAEAADRYARARPGCPPAIFDDLVAFAAIGPGCRVLEVACAVDLFPPSRTGSRCPARSIRLHRQPDRPPLRRAHRQALPDRATG